MTGYILKVAMCTHYRVHISPPLDLTLNQMNLVHILSLVSLRSQESVTKIGYAIIGNCQYIAVVK
jgi:hypothetical protein